MRGLDYSSHWVNLLGWKPKSQQEVSEQGPDKVMCTCKINSKVNQTVVSPHGGSQWWKVTHDLRSKLDGRNFMSRWWGYGDIHASSHIEDAMTKSSIVMQWGHIAMVENSRRDVDEMCFWFEVGLKRGMRSLVWFSDY